MDAGFSCACTSRYTRDNSKNMIFDLWKIQIHITGVQTPEYRLQSTDSRGTDRGRYMTSKNRLDKQIGTELSNQGSSLTIINFHDQSEINLAVSSLNRVRF